MTRRRGNPPTMQTVQRADGSMYHTLNVQRLKNASPLQTVKPEPKPAWLMRATFVIALLLICILAAGVLLPR